MYIGRLNLDFGVDTHGLKYTWGRYFSRIWLLDCNIADRRYVAWDHIVGVAQSKHVSIGGAPPDKAVEAAFYIQAVVFTAFTFVSVFGCVFVSLDSLHSTHVLPESSLSFCGASA